MDTEERIGRVVCTNRPEVGWYRPADNTGHSFLLFLDLLLWGMRLLPSFSGFLYVWLCQTLLSRCVCNFVHLNVIKKKCTYIFFQHVSEWDFDLTSFHASQNVHTKGGERWLRPAGVIQTMQAVCTDGHFDTKKAQETETQGDQTPDSTKQPHRGDCTCKAREGRPQKAACMESSL